MVQAAGITSVRALFVVCAVFVFIGCTNRTAVGRNKTSCATDRDVCPPEEPHCGVERNICAQCLDASHCGGPDPRCDSGVCVCEADEDCAEGLFCVDERCSAD